MKHSFIFFCKIIKKVTMFFFALVRVMNVENLISGDDAIIQTTLHVYNEMGMTYYYIYLL